MDDITRIKEMIASHDNQTLKTKLYISISYQNIDLYNDIIKLSNSNVILYIRDKPTTQFMHYKMLVNDLINTHNNDHILFTDDDDILHPKRNHIYNKYLQYDIIKIDSVKIFGDEFGFAKSTILDYNPDEYVNLCIKLNIVNEFLNKIDEDELNKWAFDCQFNSSISYNNIYHIKCPITLYYYRKHFMKPTRYILNGEQTNLIKIDL
jgi:hypothetical protein